MSVKIASPRAELAIIKGLCTKDKLIAGTILSSIDDSYFSSDVARELYDYVRDAYSETGKAPKRRLMLEDSNLSKDAKSWFKDGNSSIETVGDATSALKLLNRYRQLRGLDRIKNRIIDEFDRPKVKVDKLLDDIGTAFTLVRATKGTKDSFLHFGKNNNSSEFIHSMLFDDVSDEIIPTGFHSFDDVNIGFLKGSLVTIGGNSGSGKSHLASSLAINQASLGYRVTVIPLEMSKREMSARMLARITRFDSLRILSGDLSRKEKNKIEKRFIKWAKETKRLGGRYTIFKPAEDLTIEEIYASVDTIECDETILDYVTLLAGLDVGDQWKAIGSACRYAKINAENRKRVNVILCQVSDEGRIRYAQSIKEHSSNALIFTADEDTKEQGIIRLKQIKSRNQKDYDFTLKIDYAHSYVYDLSEEDDEEDLKEKKKKKKEKIPDLSSDI